MRAYKIENVCIEKLNLLLWMCKKIVFNETNQKKIYRKLWQINRSNVLYVYNKYML